jgi:SAM-dependent methyltransferase
VTFSVAAGSYDRFMGRYSTRLAPLFADFAGVASQTRVLDVGCGPGSLTGELVRRVGAAAVTAVDPSEPFVTAIRERFPDVAVHEASAEELPFDDASFDATLAQLVVHHMSDPVGGIKEMSRVTTGSGVVAACVWDHGASRTPASPFYRVARDLDPELADPSRLPGASEGHLGELFSRAGLNEVSEAGLSFDVEHSSFEDWWEPFMLGVGPVGVYLASLDQERQASIREGCRHLLPAPPFVLELRAWAARGVGP